jgi:hypothetical protein
MPSRRKRTWGWLLTCLGIPLLAGLVLWRFWLYRPVGFGPAGPEVPTAAFAGAWADKSVILVGMGDSVTAGFGALPGHSYFDRLTVNATSDEPAIRGLNLKAVFPNLSVTNLAMSGCTSAQALRAQLPKLGRRPVDSFGLVVMTIGGNDLIHNYGMSKPVDGAMYGATWAQAQPWLGTFRQRMDALLDGTIAAFPGGCLILVGNIYDPSDGTGSLRWVGMPAWPDGLRLHAEFNRILAESVAKRPQARLVDLHGTFLGHGVTCSQFWRGTYRREDPHWWYHANVEDPNDRGYDAIRRLFLNAFIDGMGRGLAKPNEPNPSRTVIRSPIQDLGGKSSGSKD